MLVVICQVFLMLFGQQRGGKTVWFCSPSHIAYTCSTLTLLDEFDSYIILSFVNGTLVLSIGETIEEVQDTGFLSSAPTLAVQQIGADALLQVHPQGIRHVLSDRRVNEWRVPQGKTIVAATTNKRQVVVALSSAELVYFELDLDGQLNEDQERKTMGSAVESQRSLGEEHPDTLLAMANFVRTYQGGRGTGGPSVGG